MWPPSLMLMWWWAVMDCPWPSAGLGQSSVFNRTRGGVSMRTLSVILACLLLSTGTSAQTRAGGSPPGQGRGAGGFATPIGVLAIEAFEVARPVKGAPYIAEAITETAQVLADGNRIERRTTATVARDSTGRIRREQSALMLGGIVVGSEVPLLTITDPSTRTHVTLDREQKVAVRMKTPAVAD